MFIKSFDSTPNSTPKLTPKAKSKRGRTMSVLIPSARRSSMKKGTKTLKDYLGNYKVGFGKDIDVLWSKYDKDNNQFLEKRDAKDFIDELASFVSNDRGKYYKSCDFEKKFDEFDDSK